MERERILLERAGVVRSLNESLTAIAYLEGRHGELRYEGLTLNQWWEIRTQREIEAKLLLDMLDHA